MRDLTMLEMVTKLAEAEVMIHVNARKALDRVGTRIEKTAKAEFGHYQDAVGPFPEWAELAESTMAERGRLGYPENEPLLRDGTLRDSISHEVEQLEVTVGSTSEIAEYHEFGTSKMPPRPFMGPALVNNHDKIIEELGGAVVKGMVGQTVIHDALGYGAKVEG